MHLFIFIYSFFLVSFPTSLFFRLWMCGMRKGRTGASGTKMEVALISASIAPSARSAPVPWALSCSPTASNASSRKPFFSLQEWTTSEEYRSSWLVTRLGSAFVNCETTPSTFTFNFDHRLPNFDPRLPLFDCRLLNFNRRLPNLHCRLPNLNRSLLNFVHISYTYNNALDSRTSTADYWTWTAERQTSTTDWQTLTTDCQNLTADC